MAVAASVPSTTPIRHTDAPSVAAETAAATSQKAARANSSPAADQP